MDIEKQKLQDDLDAERRVSYAMACALGEISEALGMDENEAGTLQAVKELLKNLKDAEFKSEQFKSDAESLRAELQKARDQKPYGYLLEHSDGAEFYNMEISANFNCTDKVQASVMPVYAAPVQAMPMSGNGEELLHMLLEGVKVESGASISEKFNALQQHWYLTARDSLAMPIPKQAPYGYVYDGHLLCNDGDFQDYFDGAEYDKESMLKLYAETQPSQAAAIPEGSAPSIEQQLEFVTADRDGIRKHRDQLLERINNAPHWVAIEAAHDMPDDDTYVLWDGCDLSVDFTDTEVEYGTTFFSNGTEATHYLAGLNPPLSAAPKPNEIV